MIVIAFVATLALALFGDVPGERPVVPSPVSTASPGATIDKATAIQLARDFFLRPQATLRPGLRLTNVSIGEVGFDTDADGRPRWRVEVSGEVEDIGNPDHRLHTVMWLSVDAETAEVRVLAVG